MAVDPLVILEKAKALGSTATLAQVQSALASISRTALENAEKARYRVEVWDEVSSLGGQPPEYWRARGDWPQGGKMYLMYRDNQLRMVQPHDPDQAGHVAMRAATVMATATAHMGRQVERDVDAEVIRQVLLQVL